jgi:hypothetical protein
MSADEVVVIRVERVDVSDGGRYAVVLGTRRFGNTSTSSIYPRFKSRMTANRVAESLAETYTQEGNVVELTKLSGKPGKVVKQ